VKEFPIVKTDWKAVNSPPKDQVQATWIGHASFLVQMDNLNILTDPIFSERCSASQLIGPKRFTPIPFQIKELPDIDLVIISHNHYDHLDTNSVEALIPKVKKWYVPLGVRQWMIDTGVKKDDVFELDWWESLKYNETCEVICTPCQHSTGRTLTDRNETLWASWSIVSSKARFYFAGDTGYRSVPKGKTEAEIKKLNLPTCPVFKEIGEKYGPFDLACIPIAAYSPRWFMSPIHANPEDAVNIHIDVKARQSVGMHWGTFCLTDEPIWEPPEVLKAELADKKQPLDSFVVLSHGETQAFLTSGKKKEKVNKDEEKKEINSEKEKK